MNPGSGVKDVYSPKWRLPQPPIDTVCSCCLLCCCAAQRCQDWAFKRQVPEGQSVACSPLTEGQMQGWTCTTSCPYGYSLPGVPRTLSYSCLGASQFTNTDANLGSLDEQYIPQCAGKWSHQNSQPRHSFCSLRMTRVSFGTQRKKLMA